jgi:hypothetical protein
VKCCDRNLRSARLKSRWIAPRECAKRITRAVPAIILAIQSELHKRRLMRRSIPRASGDRWRALPTKHDQVSWIVVWERTLFYLLGFGRGSFLSSLSIAFLSTISRCGNPSGLFSRRIKPWEIISPTPAFRKRATMLTKEVNASTPLLCQGLQDLDQAGRP